MDREKLDNIISLANRLFAGSDFECIEAEWQSPDKTLTLYVDRPGGVDIAACGQATCLVRDAEELDDMIPGTYRLEVSSPGVERPLRFRPHFEAQIGKVIEVKLLEKVEERRVATGKLVAVEGSESDARVSMMTEQGKPWMFPLRLLQRAHVVFEWGKR